MLLVIDKNGTQYTAASLRLVGRQQDVGNNVWLASQMGASATLWHLHTVTRHVTVSRDRTATREHSRVSYVTADPWVTAWLSGTLQITRAIDHINTRVVSCDADGTRQATVTRWQAGATVTRDLSGHISVTREITRHVTVTNAVTPIRSVSGVVTRERTVTRPVTQTTRQITVTADAPVTREITQVVTVVTISGECPYTVVNPGPANIKVADPDGIDLSACVGLALSAEPAWDGNLVQQGVFGCDWRVDDELPNPPSLDGKQLNNVICDLDPGVAWTLDVYCGDAAEENEILVWAGSKSRGNTPYGIYTKDSGCATPNTLTVTTWP